MVKKLVLSLAAVACFGAEGGFDKNIIAKYEWSLKQEFGKQYIVFNPDGTGKYKDSVNPKTTVGTINWKVENGLLYIAYAPSTSMSPISSEPFGTTQPKHNIPKSFSNIALQLAGTTENHKCFEVVVVEKNEKTLLCLDKYDF